MKIKIILPGLMATVMLLNSPKLFGHCDGLDGPVVNAARKALETGNVNHVLIWVLKDHEPEVSQAFEKTLAVRKLSPEAKDLADTYFFETLVRIHRAGEGEPYTGLKSAGRDLGPMIPAADQAVESGSVQSVTELMHQVVQDGIEKHFHEVMESKDFGSDDVAAGRKFVKAYVKFLHYVEQIYETAVHDRIRH